MYKIIKRAWLDFIQKKYIYTVNKSKYAINSQYTRIPS